MYLICILHHNIQVTIATKKTRKTGFTDQQKIASKLQRRDCRDHQVAGFAPTGFGIQPCVHHLDRVEKNLGGMMVPKICVPSGKHTKSYLKWP